MKFERPLVDHGFVVGKSVLSRGANGCFVVPHRVEYSPFDAGDLGREQRRAVLEVRRAVARPALELRVVRGERLQVLNLPVTRGRAEVRRHGQARVKVVLRDFQERR